jgi:hypothetical protein
MAERRNGQAGSQVPSGVADPRAFGEPISLALAHIGLIGLRNSRAGKPLLFPLWISGIVGAADLLLAMVLGSVLLLGRRSGGRSVLSTRRQRPTWGGRDDGKRPGRAGAGDPFQAGEFNRFAYSVVDFGGFGGERPS